MHYKFALFALLCIAATPSSAFTVQAGQSFIVSIAKNVTILGPQDWRFTVSCAPDIQPAIPLFYGTLLPATFTNSGSAAVNCDISAQNNNPPSSLPGPTGWANAPGFSVSSSGPSDFSYSWSGGNFVLGVHIQ